MSHRRTEIELYPVTVFVGPNGGGKSAIFEALLILSMVARGRLASVFGPGPYSYQAKKFKASRNQDSMGFECELVQSPDQEDGFRYAVNFRMAGPGSHNDRPTYSITSESLSRLPSGEKLFDRNDFNTPMGESFDLRDDETLLAAVLNSRDELTVDPLLVEAARWLQRFGRYRLEPANLSIPGELPTFDADERKFNPRLKYDGEGLSSVLYYLSEAEPETLRLLGDALKRVDPSFEEFDFNMVGTQKIAFSVVYNDGRGTVPATNLSSGTLAFIGLCTLLLSTEKPGLLLIEEPENGLTPHVLREVYRMLGAAQEPPQDDCQILISSHSPFVLVEAWNGRDRKFIYQVRNSDGRSAIRRVTEVADFGDEPDVGYLRLKVADEVMSGER